MHGLINRSLQNFVQDVYGPEVWTDVVARAELEFDEFEAMLTYDDDLSFSVLQATCDQLSKPREVLLEDLGTYLVTHPNTWRIRRLLRFGGADLIDFLLSLDDLADRARLAVPDLVLPQIHVISGAGDGARYILRCEEVGSGMEYIALGCLRAMADDYGALAMAQLMDPLDDADTSPRIEVTLLSTKFAAGNRFELTGEVH
ncbi:heme NO-binding domain-containing protein [Maribius pontilimi]|uniref:Heme NO-binding domain-containing protein n=1 Tax=Palleronia pontilimi TaxID=1964209 RepID=A0A934MHM5_9RHOB|nr:heme NO-binding domain-containing protein [Palleronia pontilimi]MBJ3763444.1 heme NO-binding domain-containing protein [Palleronia pontilimi]